MRSMTSLNLLAALYGFGALMQQPGAAGAASGLNSTEPRPADADIQWPEGDLPEQMLGGGSVLMPGDRTFRLPPASAMPQLWHDVVAEDQRPGSPTKGQKLNFRQLKFDSGNPLVVVGGPDDGEPFRDAYSTVPRARGKKDDPATAYVSDIAYLLSVSLGDKRRPKNQQELEQIINSYGGQTVRLRTGLSGQCRPDKAVRIEVYDPTDTTYAAENRQPRTMVIDDPTGRKGCGKRFYTEPRKNAPTAYKNPNGGAPIPGTNPVQYEPKYYTELQCDNEVPHPQAGQPDGQGGVYPATMTCDAIVRGYPRTEGFLPPLAGK